MRKSRLNKEPDKIRIKVEEELTQIAIELVKEKKGALFVIGDSVEYTHLNSIRCSPFNVLSDGAKKLIKGLAVIDGAVIFDELGNFKIYGALIKTTRVLKNYGTRHAGAVSGSMNGNTSILCSEEEQLVKIFKNGKLMLEINPFQIDRKNVPIAIGIAENNNIQEVLEMTGAGAIGAGILVPTVGISIVPGVILCGIGYKFIKTMIKKDKLKYFKSKGFDLYKKLKNGGG